MKAEAGTETPGLALSCKSNDSLSQAVIQSAFHLFGQPSFDARRSRQGYRFVVEVQCATRPSSLVSPRNGRHRLARRAAISRAHCKMHRVGRALGHADADQHVAHAARVSPLIALRGANSRRLNADARTNRLSESVQDTRPQVLDCTPATHLYQRSNRDLTAIKNVPPEIR